MSPDARHILHVNEDGHFWIWALTPGPAVCAAHVPCGKATSACWSPDGRFVLFAAGDGRLHLWSTVPPAPVRIFAGHHDEVGNVCFTADGGFALSSSEDGSVRIWDVGSGQCVRILHGHRQGVGCIAVSPDVRYALSGGGDGNSFLWALDWELADNEPPYWDDRAWPWLETFLTLHTPYLARWDDPKASGSSRLFRRHAGSPDQSPSKEEIARMLTRAGSPIWCEEDFHRLMDELGRAGFGWLQPEDVRRQLLNYRRRTPEGLASILEDLQEKEA
jgi:WD40 repeat protein